MATVRRQTDKRYLIPYDCKVKDCKNEGIIVWGVFENRRYNCIHHLKAEKERIAIRDAKANEVKVQKAEWKPLDLAARLFQVNVMEV